MNINTNINYQKQLDKFIEKLDYVPTLLMHSCCGPCSSYCLEYLSNYFKITIFYYNPNIYPSQEYDDRIQEQKKIIEYIDAKYQIDLIEGNYDTKIFYDTIKGFENEKEGGKRCHLCYELRLKEAALLAKEFNFDYFTTTLTISPQKNSHVLNYIGKKCGDEVGVKYLDTDFKKKNGYKRSVEITKELDIYRQDYCGCIFSKRAMNEKKTF